MSLLLSAKRSGKHRSTFYNTTVSTPNNSTHTNHTNNHNTNNTTPALQNQQAGSSPTMNPFRKDSPRFVQDKKIPISWDTLEAIQIEYESSRPSSQYQLANCIKNCPLILNLHSQTVPKQHDDNNSNNHHHHHHHYYYNNNKDSVEWTALALQHWHLKQSNDPNDAQLNMHKQHFIKAMDTLMTMVKSIERDIHDWKDAKMKLAKVLVWSKEEQGGDDEEEEVEEEKHLNPKTNASANAMMNDNDNHDNHDNDNNHDNDDNHDAPIHRMERSKPTPTPFTRLQLWHKDSTGRMKKKTTPIKKHKTSFKYRTSNIKAYLHLLRNNDIKGRWDKVSLFQNDGLDQIKYGTVPERIVRRQKQHAMESKDQDRFNLSRNDGTTISSSTVVNDVVSVSTLTQEKKEEPLYIRLARLFQKKTEKEEEKVREKELEQDKRIEREMEELEKRLAKKEEEEKDAAKKLLRPLTDEENDIVQEALYGNGMPTEKVATSETDSVQRKSMQTLRPCAWLNDEVIHYFLHVLSMRDEALSNKIPGRKRSHFFKSFFFTKLLDEGATNTYRYSNVKRWSKKVPGKDIFQLDKIFFVCNISGMHWTCVCAFMKEKRIQFYDSMGGSGHDYVEGVFQYFQDEWKSKNGGELPDADQWEVNGETPMGTPKQRNGYDCGVFTCMFCDFLSMDRALTFTQQHVDQCRDRIALSIMKGIAIE